MVRALLAERFPLTAFARLQGLQLAVVDSGVAEPLAPQPRLLARKIAHGTRNSRVGPAMSVEQAHAAMRAGMEIADSTGGSAVACAGIGVGSAQSAALVLAALSGVDLRDFVVSGPAMPAELRSHLLLVLESVRHRHQAVEDPIEMLAALGGFEIAMMVGLMLAAASRRRLIIPDGLAACAALLVASKIAPAIPEYCVHVRSSPHQGLAFALRVFGAKALIEVGLDSIDGTGAAMAWPLVRSAAALLTEAGDAMPATVPVLDEPVDGAKPVLSPSPTYATRNSGGRGR